ncbi:hypothetical protein ACGFJ7_34065 [Actinoplanes sp. NPDC048988]|uniref:hypothetical protein n=1 Tax=Actinoplanes sp. NPDC048988 TaxID=3363901 RepID=UPI003716D311
MVVLSALAGCRSGTTSKPEDNAADPPSATAGTCAGVRSPECRSVTLASGRQVRYAILRPTAAGPQTTGAVVADLGGPGISLFGMHWPGDALRQQLPKQLQASPLLLIEEPWVTAAYPPECKAAVSSLFHSVHVLATTGETVSTSCKLYDHDQPWGWTPETFAEAVKVILATEGLRLDGYLGLSFGGRRLTYLRDLAPKWAILVNPAPLDLSAPEYLSGRVSALWRSVESNCPQCPGRQAGTRLIEQASKALSAAQPAVPGRSVPLAGGDVAAATLALSYRDTAVMRAFFTALSTPAKEANRKLVGRLADGVWSRYGTDQISPAVLAYWAEVCPSYPGWPATPPADPLGTFLTEWHGPCTALTPAARQRWTPGLNSKVATCVSMLADDPVVPVQSVRTWRNAGAQVIQPAKGEHSDLAGAQGCADRLKL